jgi:hypothetical protein
VRLWSFEMGINSNQFSWKDTPTWLKTIIVASLINVLSFTVISFYLGGDALFGKEESGSFYLYNHDHYLEVSERVFQIQQNSRLFSVSNKSVSYHFRSYFSCSQKKNVDFVILPKQANAPRPSTVARDLCSLRATQDQSSRERHLPFSWRSCFSVPSARTS